MCGVSQRRSRQVISDSNSMCGFSLENADNAENIMLKTARELITDFISFEAVVRRPKL